MLCHSRHDGIAPFAKTFSAIAKIICTNPLQVAYLLLPPSAMLGIVGLPVQAQTYKGFYNSINSGVSLPGSQSVSTPGLLRSFLVNGLFLQAGYPNAQLQTISYGAGYNFNATLGYAFEFGLRLEGQFFYSNNTVSSSTGGGGSGGTVSNTAGLFNVFYDIPISSQFFPYLGAGLGFSSVQASNVPLTPVVQTTTTTINNTSSSTTFFLPQSASGSATVFAYQLAAGLGYAITPSLLLDLSYRYVGTLSYSLGNTLGNSSTFGNQSLNTIQLGLRIGF